MGIQNDITVFERVAQSIANSPEKHAYVQVTGSTSKEQGNKKQASAFKEITTYVANILNSKADLEDKKKIARSFEAILDPFVKKKKIINYIFFFLFFIKNKQINQARELIRNFNLTAGKTKSEPSKDKPKTSQKTKSEPTPKTLKERNLDTEAALQKDGIFVSLDLVYPTLAKSPLGSYAIWKEGNDYKFIQKKKSEPFKRLDLIDKITISSNEDLKKKLQELLSQPESLKILTAEKKVFEDFESASQALGVSTSYAFFHKETQDGKTLHFIQKIPGLDKYCPSIPISPNENLFTVLRTQTNEAYRLSLLAQNNVKICSNSAELSPAPKEDFYLDCTHQDNIHAYCKRTYKDKPTKNTFGTYFKESSRSMNRLNPDLDLFMELEFLLLQSKNAETLAHLNDKHSIVPKNEALSTLNRQATGGYILWEESQNEYGFLLKTNTQKLYQIDDFIRISKEVDLAEAIDHQLSQEMCLKKLKLEGKYFEDYDSMASQLNSSYAFFKKEESLYFIQKVPSIPLAECQPVLVPATNNLFTYANEQMHIEKRVALLESHKKICVCKDQQHYDESKKKLVKSGDWLVDASQERILKLVWMNEFKSLSFRVIQPSEDIFWRIDRDLGDLQKRLKDFEAIKLSEHIFKSVEEAEAYLQGQSPGQYALAFKTKGTVAFLIKKPDGEIAQLAWKDEKLVEKVVKWTSHEGLLTFIQDKFARNDREFYHKQIIAEPEDYLIWKTKQGYSLMFIKKPNEEISLDRSENLFAQIEKHRKAIS